MFEQALLGGTPRREIVVQTHMGTEIRNYIAAEVNQADINLYHGQIRRDHPHWIPRRDAVGIYNCAGMVWASRRTCLTESLDWERILQEDGYRKLDNIDDGEVGDVVIYRSKRSREITHVARVCKKEYLGVTGFSSEKGRPILSALSKWDQRCGEDIHKLDDVVTAEESTPEVWTDRPAKPDSRIQNISNLPLVSP